MDGQKLRFHWPENASKRSQDLPEAYYDAGQFYFFHVQRFLEVGSLFMSGTLGLEIPESEVQDIDNEEDWRLAEMKFSCLQERK
jgi:N-acylneuraminate cytidylyltransferase